MRNLETVRWVETEGEKDSDKERPRYRHWVRDRQSMRDVDRKKVVDGDSKRDGWSKNARDRQRVRWKERETYAKSMRMTWGPWWSLRWRDKQWGMDRKTDLCGKKATDRWVWQNARDCTRGCKSEEEREEKWVAGREEMKDWPTEQRGTGGERRWETGGKGKWTRESKEESERVDKNETHVGSAMIMW